MKIVRGNRLAGKSALVTGAARGIGAATARRFVEEGARVLLTDIDEAAVTEQVAAISADLGEGLAFSIRHDVTREDDWDATLVAAADLLGGLSVLVNSAGVAVVGSIEDLTLTEWRRGMAINVESIFIGCQRALPLLRESQPASIVNLSSISGLIASGSFANYNASKAAVWLLTKSIALHCARNRWDIRCNSVHPAFIRTPMIDGLVPGADEETMAAKLGKQVPIGRIGEAVEVADAIVYLGSDESRFMTASELKLDGGLSAG